MTEPNWDELIDEMLDAEEFDGRDTARAALLAAIQTVVGERDKFKRKSDIYRMWIGKVQDGATRLAESIQLGGSDIQNAVMKEHRKLVDIANKDDGLPTYEYCQLESDLRAANEENEQLNKAINGILDLGLQRLPVDKRWGTAFAIAREAVKHRARGNGGG